MSEVAIERDFLGAFGIHWRQDSLLLVGNRRVLAEGEEPCLVFDLPGGRVEPGEGLVEALIREWEEECSLHIRPGALCFVQEGHRYRGERRCYAWRSFFFEVEAEGEPRVSGEVESLLWAPRDRLGELLGVPHHAGFLRWLEDGALLQQDRWEG